ncbi:MAG: translation initiation factor IF-2 [Candidatus Omnitrophica bacterium]|nr:translation initiation factor IF-2 [Candidatus Omnitrophota bacterium]
MLVRDLAKKYNIAEDTILATLKTLKLRAKGDEHELSPAVILVLKGELEEKGLIPKEPEPKPARKPVAKKVVESSDAVGVTAKKKKDTKVAEKTEKLDEKAQDHSRKQILVSYKAGVVHVPKPEPKVELKTEAKTALAVETTAAVKVEAASGQTAVKEELPNELAQFEKKPDEQASADGKKVVKKVIKKVIKKVVHKEQPEFIAMKPLAHGKRRTVGDAPVGQQAAVAGEQDKSADQQIAGTQSARREGPLVDIEMKIPITVGDLAFRIQQKANIVLKTLMNRGIFAHINQNLGEEMVRKICEEFGFNLKEVKSQEEQLVSEHEREQDAPESLKLRAPVVTFMGHVDHGKTSLLDAIRKTKVVDTEHGGITQHIRAYSVKLPKGNITFLDTPGHAAFTAMRARGAHVTDLVVLVVAANEGIMPQTLEAIDHARAGNVPIVVAMNKIDRPDADIESAKKQLMQHDLMPEDWGGKTVVVPVSAHTGEGIDTLLEMILLEAEMLECKANPNKRAAGIVVEAHLSPGKGALATLIVQSGTLKDGDIVIVGPYYGRVKAMFDDRKRPVHEVGPSGPVEILGLPAVPEAGERFFVVEEERIARDITTVREEKLKAERLRSTSKVTLEDLFAQKQAGEVKELNVIIKGDVQGSVEAIRDSLLKVPAENKEVAIRFIHCGVGNVNASDVILAAVSKAIIVAFGVGTNADAEQELGKSPVQIRRYNVIYDVVNDVRDALEGMLKPDEKRHFIARAEVRQVFKLSKSGIVAGCFMLKGKMRTKLDVEVIRNGLVIHTNKVTTLKRFKDDVREVGEGFECGISVGGFDGYQTGDLIEAFQIEQIARKL